jgi:hypothetical protein
LHFDLFEKRAGGAETEKKGAQIEKKEKSFSSGNKTHSLKKKNAPVVDVEGS